MADYVITAPNGKKYKVSGQGTKEEALAHLQSTLGQSDGKGDMQQPANEKPKEWGIPGLLTINQTSPTEALKNLDAKVRMFGEGATFGFGDKVAAKVDESLGQGNYSQNLAENRATTARAEDVSGGAGQAMKIMGSMAPMAKATQVGATFMNVPKVGKYLGGLMDGAMFGGLDAAGHDQSIAKGSGLGALAGGAGQVVGNAVAGSANKIATALQKKAPIPEIEQLQAAKSAAYKAVDDSGGGYAPEQIDELVRGIQDEMSAARLNPRRVPKAASVLEDDILPMSGKPMTFTDLDQLRQVVARDVAGAADGSERFFGQKMIANIDEFEQANGNNLSQAARDANSKFRKTERVLNAVEKADRRAASTGSGGNADNTIRQNIRAILDNPKLKRGYSKQELDQMELVVAGTEGQNALRLAGKLSPEGNGLMAALGLGGAMVNPIYGIPAIGGALAKRSADKATRTNVDELLRLLTTGKMTQPKTVIGKSQRDAIVKALMAGSIATAQ